MWFYKRNGLDLKFRTKEAFAEFVIQNDMELMQYINYWYIDECFEPEDLKHDLALGHYEHLSITDWFSDALDAVEDSFSHDMFEPSENKLLFGILFVPDE